MSASDLDEDWRWLQQQTIKLVTSSDLVSQLELAKAKAEFDLAQFEKTCHGKEVTPELFREITNTAISKFLEHWRLGLSDRKILGLIEVILEKQELPLTEVQAFLQAMPLSVLTSLISDVKDTANGVVGILALEVHRRKGKIQGYTLGREGGRLFVDTQHPLGLIRVFTDDSFPVIQEIPT